MRFSAVGFLVRLILLIFLAVLVILLVQGGYMMVISTLLKNSQSGLPNFSSTQVSGFGFPTARPPGHVGEGLIVGKIALYVTGVTREGAGGQIARASSFTTLKNGEEYLWVNISVNCRASNESCRVTENDFGVRGAAGHDYSAEFSSMFSGLNGLFAGGEIAAGGNMSGGLVFIIQSNDSGLRLFYPRFFGFGSNSAEFVLP